jgi:hypothetical protein
MPALELYGQARGSAERSLGAAGKSACATPESVTVFCEPQCVVVRRPGSKHDRRCERLFATGRGRRRDPAPALPFREGSVRIACLGPPSEV